MSQNKTPIGLYPAASNSSFASIPATYLKHLWVPSYSKKDPNSPAPEQHGYQRDPVKSRFPRIARHYLAHQADALITPITLSVRLRKKRDIGTLRRLLEQANFEKIHAHFGKAVISVVDGQHRIGGLIYATSKDKAFNPNVPCIIYFGMSYEREAELFGDINTNQKRLPRALVEVTLANVTDVGNKTYEQRVRNIALLLATDPKSPFCHAINMTGGRDLLRRLSFEGLRRATQTMLSRDSLRRLNGAGVKDYYALILRYWQLVATSCKSAWDSDSPAARNVETGQLEKLPRKYRIKELVGIASLARLGRDVILSSLDRRAERTIVETIQDCTSRLEIVDWEKRPDNPWMQSQAGFAGQRVLYELLVDLVYNGSTPIQRAA